MCLCWFWPRHPADRSSSAVVWFCIFKTSSRPSASVIIIKNGQKLESDQWPSFHLSHKSPLKHKSLSSHQNYILSGLASQNARERGHAHHTVHIKNLPFVFNSKWKEDRGQTRRCEPSATPANRSFYCSPQNQEKTQCLAVCPEKEVKPLCLELRPSTVKCERMNNSALKCSTPIGCLASSVRSHRTLIFNKTSLMSDKLGWCS